MEKDNYNNIYEDISGFVLKVSESMSKIVEGINVMASSKTLLAFVEFFQNIPDDIKDTQFYKKVQGLSKKENMHYEDVVWFVENFGLSYTEATWKKLTECENDKSALQRYMAKTIVSTSMEERE
jgi:hypothetical protein